MEENTGEFLCNVGIGKDFLTITQNSDTTNEKVINLTTHIHIKTLTKKNKRNENWGKNSDIYHRQGFNIPSIKKLLSIEWER